MGGKPDPSTKLFETAVGQFAEASGHVYGLRVAAIDLQETIAQLEGDISRKERAVAGSEAVQERPEDGPHNAETRVARTVSILASDEAHVLTMARLEGARHALARNDAELEQARDARALARRSMDFAVASRRGEDDAG